MTVPESRRGGVDNSRGPRLACPPSAGSRCATARAARPRYPNGAWGGLFGDGGAARGRTSGKRLVPHDGHGPPPLSSTTSRSRGRKSVTCWSAVPVDRVPSARWATGSTAVAAIDEQQPDLVFLDIHMPRLSGLDILHRARHAAGSHLHDRLRPVRRNGVRAGRSRLSSEAVRARATPVTSLERVRALLGRDRPRPVAAVRSRRKRSPAGPARRLLYAESRAASFRSGQPGIVRLEASDDFVYVHTTTERYRMGVPLQQIAERLEPTQFVRVHRSHIVNLDHVASFLACTTDRASRCGCAKRPAHRRQPPVLTGAARPRQRSEPS